MSLTGYLPLVAALALAGVLALTRVSPRVDRVFTRIARQYFSQHIGESPARKRMLASAYLETTYRVYAAKTYLYTALAALIGGTVGVYFIGGALVVIPTIAAVLADLPSVMGDALGNRNLEIVLPPDQVFLVLTIGGVVIGGLSAVVTYVARWQLPAGDAEVRRRGINAALPRTVAFTYALSRGGLAFPDVMRTLGRNREIYGDAADEMSVAVREMDIFGTDMISAIRRTAHRSPSDTFRTFAENLASVLASGQQIPQFLEDQYDRLQAETEQRQEEVLELLATIAEAYVTTLVAGILFLLTILLVFGLTVTDTLPFLQLLAYLIVPLSNALFVVFLVQKLEELGVARESGVGTLKSAAPDTTAPETTTATADGGHLARLSAGRSQLALYDRISRFKRVLRRPIQTIIWNPTRIFYLTVPIALIWLVIRGPAAMTDYGFNLRYADDVIVQITIFLIGSFATVREIYSRRIDRIEAATPELLERLASLNEAGMSFVESLDRVRDSDLGVLTDEVDRIWTDISMGANATDALRRFGLRVRTASIARVVTLLTHAMRASGRLGPVLRIASSQARADLKLRRERRQQMFTYLVVIYVSFLVFLVIIFAVEEVLVPSLPDNVPVPESNRLGVDVTAFARLGQVNKPAYTLIFLHAALIQAVLSGFVAGLLGEGTLKDGAKHAAILLSIAYVAILLVTSPVASLTIQDQETLGDGVTIDSVSTSEGGFVVIHERTADGAIVGHTGYLPPGEHTNVRVQLDESIQRQTTLVAVPHIDTSGDNRFTIGIDQPYATGGDPVAVDAQITPVERETSQSLGRESALSAQSTNGLALASWRASPM
ncbi:type II secretion system F family protein [Halorhabdus sp. BNX81]|uniref:type II secretion system F family protein n=1 Tax=Halorhabdus sp. BNX81 TaxID=2980181 RepID=UPI0023DCECE1|nr:type II secretion system F family protein [Halorhabdus sp. BNX81]WEL21807.1 Archaeal flagellar protein FlaJ [Halorhabdus sp. BNX81]